MTIKHVLTPISSEVDPNSALGTGLLVAKEFNAHLDAVFYKFPLGGPVALEMDGGFIEDSIRERTEEQDSAAVQARQVFDDEISERKIEYLEAPLPAERPSAAWRISEVEPFQGIRNEGGAYDLIVVGRSFNSVSQVPNDLIEASLFYTGRPILVASANQPKNTGGTVLIAWNRSQQSARAISAARPFIEMAKKVIVFSIATGAKEGPTAEQIGRYLSWHQVKNEVVEIPHDYRSVGDALLDEANKRDVDLIVMGAYSRSRLRELLLGGVTKHVLQNASLPVLMMR